MDKNKQKIYVGLISLAMGLVLNSFKNNALIPDDRLVQQFVPIFAIGLILMGIIYIIIGTYKANKAYKDSNKK